MNNQQKNKMKLGTSIGRKLLIGAMTFACALPLSAQEQSSVKLNLPDGVYGGCSFIVKDNQLYTTPDAVKKLGVPKLNEWFAGKKYKVLFGGEKIGDGYHAKISDDIELNKISTCNHIFQRDSRKPHYFNKEKIIKTPLYLKDSVFNNGSVMLAITAPEAYKEVTRKIYRSITPEEVVKVEKLAQEQLIAELRSRKELERAHGGSLNLKKLDDIEIAKSKLVMLDKVFRRNQEMYIGTYDYTIKDGDGISSYMAVFSVMENVVKFITGFDEPVGISGMLDIDGCGEDELIIRKGIEGEDKYVSWMEIYKQENDGTWAKIIESKKIENAL